MISEADILKKINQQPKHAARFKHLAHDLGVRGDARHDLADLLGKMVSAGKLQQLNPDTYAAPAKTAGHNTVVGRLSLHRDGYGFVLPEPTSIDERLKARLSGDIFIPPPAVGSAMHGDRVVAEVSAVRPDGRAEGRILRIANHANATVVGTFHYASRHNYVAPIDQKISQEIVIPRGMEIPAASNSGAESGELSEEQPRGPKQSVDRVLGSEAALHRDAKDLEGMIVNVEITDWPTATQNPRGRVVEILGYHDDFGVDVEIMIRKFHLPHQFPAEVLHEARATSSLIPSAEIERRRDFRALPIVTIDGETARDFDDAVLVRNLDNGNFELQVHIADVANYVREDSEIDREARLRGTSVYFPDRAVPMLPLELSTDICSLRPQVDRLVMSCVMEIDHHGEIVGYDLSEGVIRSAERMTYTGVNAVLEGDEAARERYAPLVAEFERMRELALILHRKRERRGSIDFDLPEPVIEFDEFGLMKSISRSERNIAHRLIEEFMLAANECVAQYLENHRVASLYRIHEKPEAKRVYDFEIIAATFGYSLGVGPLPIQRVQLKTDRRASRATGKRTKEIEIPKEVHITPRMYQKLTEKIAGKPEERILSFLMLRSLKQARYSEQNLGHFALASPCYTHFTSPIRRYPDLIVHRILKQVLPDHVLPHHVGRTLLSANSPTKPATPWSKRLEHTPAAPTGGPIPIDVLHEIAEESSQSERRADDAERELMEWKKVKFMQDRVGEDFDALIISITKFGFFVELTDLFVEGLVPLDSLQDDRYTFHENTREIIGQRNRRIYRMGQRQRVILDRIDPVEKKLQFAVFEEIRPARKSRKR